MKKAKSILILAVLTVVLLAECVVLFIDTPKAEPVFPCPGIITANPSCNMRRDPNTQREAIRELRQDVKVTVLAEVEGEPVGDNNRWYEIQYGNLHGYVSTSFVSLDTTDVSLPSDLPPPPNIPGEAEFLAGLQNQGFPEDYQQKLLELHRKHPYWTFKSLHTTYSFESAVAGEDRPGVNMVPATSPPEYKSMADADFNYTTNTWYEYEKGWVGASKALIAYQMDPRNFLDEIQIFQFENQQFNKSIDYRRGLTSILKGSFMEGPGPIHFYDTEGGERGMDASYVDLLMAAGETSGVSPYHLASRIRQEVSPQGSGSVSGTYGDLKGYYNFYNIGAFNGPDPLYSGLVTAKNGIQGYSAEKNAEFMFPWDDPWKAICGGAVFIGKDYINVDQNTLYLQKFNLVSRYSRPFTHQYMGNVLAPEYEAIDVYKAYEKMGALDEVKEFVIPVFASMPAVTPSPTGGGNPNNWLESISINGEFIPNFNPTIYEYRIEIHSATDGIFVQGFPWNAGSAVAGSGLYKLHAGYNEIILQVKAPTGGVRNYRLSVRQGESTADENPDTLPPMKSGEYKLNPLGYLYGADPLNGTNSREAILAGFQVPAGYTTELTDASGNTPLSEAGTGSILNLKDNGRTVNQFPIVILGDVNGDGSIDVMDLNILYGVVARTTKSPGMAYELAMDVNQDGFTDIVDLNLIYSSLNGGKSIPQRLLK